MEKIYLLFLGILLVPSVLAVCDSTYFLAQDIDRNLLEVCFICENPNGTRCDINTSCTSTVNYPNGTDMNNAQDMNFLSNGIFNYSIEIDTTYPLGNYETVIFCNNSYGKKAETLVVNIYETIEQIKTTGGGYRTRAETKPYFPKDIEEGICNSVFEFLDLKSEYYTPLDMSQLSKNISAKLNILIPSDDVEYFIYNFDKACSSYGMISPLTTCSINTNRKILFLQADLSIPFPNIYLNSVPCKHIRWMRWVFELKREGNGDFSIIGMRVWFFIFLILFICFLVFMIFSIRTMRRVKKEL